MGICWSWAFGPESRTDMLDMDWVTFSTSYTKQSAADKVYSYSGSPTRYSSQFAGASNASMRPPDKAVANWQPGSGGTEQQGWVATPVKRYNNTVGNGTVNLIQVVTRTVSVSYTHLTLPTNREV